MPVTTLLQIGEKSGRNR